MFATHAHIDEVQLLKVKHDKDYQCYLHPSFSFPESILARVRWAVHTSRLGIQVCRCILWWYAFRLLLYPYSSLNCFPVLIDASSVRYLDGVAVPLMILNARDDPFIDPLALIEAAKRTRTNPNVLLVVTEAGGNTSESVHCQYSNVAFAIRSYGISWESSACWRSV